MIIRPELCSVSKFNMLSPCAFILWAIRTFQGRTLALTRIKAVAITSYEQTFHVTLKFCVNGTNELHISVLNSIVPVRSVSRQI